MVNFISLVLGIVALCSTQVVASTKPSGPSQYCFYAAYQSLSKFTWPTSSASTLSLLSGVSALDTRSTSKTKVATYCSNPVEVISLYASTRLYCSADEIEDGIVLWKKLCKAVDNTLMDLGNITTEVTVAYAEALPIVDPESSGKNVTVPSVIIQTYFERARRSYKDSVNAKPISIVMGWALMGFWGGVLVLGMAANAVSVLIASHALHQRSGKEHATSRQSFFVNVLLWVPRWIRTNLVIPSAFGAHHQRRLMWCTIPKRLDFFIVFGFWSAIIIFLCVRYDVFHGNTLYPSLSRQIWVYLGPRAGILAYSCLPWLWLFAGRNNIFIWATGWTYRTFSIFHRHIARATTMLALIHAISYTVKYKVWAPSTYTEDIAVSWFRFGIVALIIMATLLLFSTSWLRVRYYEVFLLIHITFAIILVVALFIHTSDQDGKYNGYLWPIVALWVFDRSVRLARLVICNVRVRFSSSVIKTSSAVAAYDAAQDVIKLDVYPESSLLKPAPGQYYHLYQPFTLRGWENHPFTLGAYSRIEQSVQPTEKLDVEKGALEGLRAISCESDYRDEGSFGYRLTFWIRPYDGWTKHLRDQCLKVGGPVRQKLFIEGPYGHKAPLHSFDSVVFITGGTGLSSALPYILDHEARSAAGTTRTSKMSLFLAARQREFFEELRQNELAGPLRRTDFTGHFFCTSSPGRNKSQVQSIDSSSSQGEVSPSESSACSCEGDASNVHDGRPDIMRIICDAAAEASRDGSRIAVLVCGPANMADEARAAVHTALKNGCHSLEYYEDAFGW